MAGDTASDFSFLAAPQNILRMAGADEAELKEVLREWEEKRKTFITVLSIIVLKELTRFLFA